MDLNEANRFKVYIIESLEGDMHTGQNLYDYLRQRNVDYTDYMFDLKRAGDKHRQCKNVLSPS